MTTHTVTSQALRHQPAGRDHHDEVAGHRRQRIPEAVEDIDCLIEAPPLHVDRDPDR
jgi:hypothetical protein